MSLINTLHTLLKQSLPNLHGARLNALMAAVGAGLTGASVSITALGRAVSGSVFIKHKIKRLDRLVVITGVRVNLSHSSAFFFLQPTGRPI